MSVCLSLSSPVYCLLIFSLLVGVCLSDVTEEFAGNLLVWPGSHKLLHACKAAARTSAANASAKEKGLSSSSSSSSSSVDSPDPGPDHGAIDVALLQRMVAAEQLTAQGREITEANLEQLLATAAPTPPPPPPSGVSPHHDNAPAHLPDLGPPHHVLARAGNNVTS